MKRISFVLILVAVMTSATLIDVQAQGKTFEPCRPEGAVRGCNAQGKPGHQTCDGGTWTVCRPSPPPPPKPVTGTATPKYYILTVVYAPPGTNGGSSSSSVSYGSESAAGSTVSSSDSFKQGATITATAEGGVLGEGGSAAGSFGITSTSSNTNSLEVKQSGSTEINDSGPSADGINHDHDVIYLWLKPTLQLKLFPTTSGNAVSSVTWSPINTNQMVVTYVYVGWLTNPSQMPPGETQLLQSYGISQQDYPEILKADPFAASSPPATPDPQRYQPLFITFPYEPPFSPGDPVPTLKFTATYTKTQGASSTAENEYTVGLSLSSEGGFPGLAKLTLKDELNWTWNSTDTRSTSNETTNSAAVTVGGPAFGYQGPTDMAVYYDVLYKTFLFAPLPTTPPTLTGAVTTRAGKAVSGKEVIISSTGKRYRTYTNAKGEYRVFGNLSGPVRVQVERVTKQLPQLPSTRRADIALP